ncbi:DUF6320 domain-containing protein [Fusibacter tunisiensis]|uniref:Membrane channel-forming protein YqfA (Hemolysin III family) n=1 Tax=Fusibacter tunisiensis TaxID=1008308 RepID=A0ABS2MUC0_9FIRM|nr:DUF6320 domain-containing protein [Fusibacter tunisiensis]MBM7563002.1 putative membrane channel-forming protein YqfA (hemolysin III family) [Fusibacter tunisiensis]
MAYCSKCGVELEPHVPICPLCNYEIPEELVQKQIENSAFPEAMNAYEKQAYATRNKILYTYTIVVIAGMLISLTLNFIASSETALFKIIMLSLAASNILVFLMLGYIKRVDRVLLYMGIAALIVTLILDSLDGNLVWAHRYAMPMIILSTLIAVLTAKRYKKIKNANHYIFIPVFICIALALILPFIELVISLNIKNKVYLSWSLISSISLLAFSGLLSGLYFKLPDYIKERLIRLFHM